MASQIHNQFNASHAWFRCQRCHWLIVFLVLLQWCYTKDDVTLHQPNVDTKICALFSNMRNDVTTNLTNQFHVKLKTKVETSNVKEKTMCACKDFRSLGPKSNKANSATDVIFTGCMHTVNIPPSGQGNLLKISHHVHTIEYLIKMYMDVYFGRHRNNKQLNNINTPTDGGRVDMVKPLTKIGFIGIHVSKISISVRSILIKLLIFVFCVCVVTFNGSYIRKDGIKFDRDVVISNTSNLNAYSIFKQTRFSFLNAFYNIPRVRLHIYPFSLNQYANDVVKEQRTVEELMKYEWSRYLSFKNFPLDCHMMPMRLAQAGFYYTGHGQEVKCFSCGIINRDWSTDETAVEVHKRVSPGCHFIRGENTDNVEIHAKEHYNGMFSAASYYGDSGQRPARSAFRTNSGSGDSDLSVSVPTSGANGGPFDALNSTPRVENNRNTASNKTMNHSNNCTGQSHQAATTTVSSSSPKHPQYTELAARVGSFMGWTLLEIQDPVELAQAGFFYTGVKDFVRCFYCGVGLKNWERGDNPWTEHSRWSHGCSHLLSSRAGSGTEGDRVTGREVSVPTQPAANQQNNGALPGHGRSDRSIGTSVSSDMDSAAARSLMDMGYTHEQVQTSVGKYRAQNGTQPMTDIALVGLLEEHESLDDAASLPPQLQTTGNSTSEHSPRNAPNIDQTVCQQSSIGDKSITSQTNTSAENTSERRTPSKRHDTKKRSNNSEGAKSLLEENRELKSRMQCKICLDRNANMIFLPCGHMVACQTCAVPLRKCAICRKLIKGSVRVYQS